MSVERVSTPPPPAWSSALLPSSSPPSRGLHSSSDRWRPSSQQSKCLAVVGAPASPCRCRPPARPSTAVAVMTPPSRHERAWAPRPGVACAAREAFDCEVMWTPGAHAPPRFPEGSTYGESTVYLRSINWKTFPQWVSDRFRYSFPRRALTPFSATLYGLSTWRPLSRAER